MLKIEQSGMITLVAERLRALGDETRIRLLLSLKDGPASVTSLAEALSTPQPSISKHLAILKTAGLVDSQRDGNQIFYRVRDENVFDMCALVCQGVIRHVQAQHEVIRPLAHPTSRKGRVA